MKYSTTRFYVYPGMDHVFQYLLFDLKNEKNCTIVDELFRNHFVKSLWKSFVKHPTLNARYGEILRIATSHCLSIPDCKDKNKVIVLSNIAVQYFPDFLLKKLKNIGYKLVLYFLDDLSNANSRIALKKTEHIQFDLICTFDRKNAEEKGFLHIDSMYSKLDNTDHDITFDLCFVGSDKGRYPIVKEIFDTCKRKELKPIVYLLQIDHEQEIDDPSFVINQSIDYAEVVCLDKKSNCILDVVLGEQNGLSLRAYEAVAYNKKLLTNNKSIFQFAFYDSRYMRYFEKIEDIDWQFVMQRDDVDYKYKGEYSPIAFLKKVCDIL